MNVNVKRRDHAESYRLLMAAVRPSCIHRCGRLKLEGLHEAPPPFAPSEPAKSWALWSCPTCHLQHYHCDGVLCVGPAYLDESQGSKRRPIKPGYCECEYPEDVKHEGRLGCVRCDRIIREDYDPYVSTTNPVWTEKQDDG